MPQFIATCAKDLEYLLVDELRGLGAIDPKEGLSQVHFECDWKGVYRILMWSRIASRIYYPIATFEALDDDALYENVSIIDWSQHLKVGASFIVNSQAFRSKLDHTQFISQRIKDSIVDYFRDSGEKRPDVEFEEPDVVIHCRIRRDKVTVSIDLAGAGMHRRGYRLQGGGAPLKENLAAALLTRAGWNQASNTLYDPMCGSGTFLIEAAMIALDIAPGEKRSYLGLFGWNQFNQKLWDEVVEEAELRRELGMKRNDLCIAGSDVNPKAVKNAHSNLTLAGLQDYVTIRILAIDQLEQIEVAAEGILIVNPPYSERLGERDEVKLLYRQLGEVLKKHFVGWTASVLSPDKVFGHALGIRANKIYKFNNASIPCELLNLQLQPQSFVDKISDSEVEVDFKSKLSEQAIQLCHRLEKNLSKLKKHLHKEGISCYRIYDADLPDYNAAIDVYEGRLHIQEYKPPKTIDEKIAIRRLKEIERVAAGVFQIPRNQVFSKQRRQQKGEWQYQSSYVYGKENSDKNFFTISEAGRKFQVNLCDYLDTGLFLDHRKTREIIAQKAKGKTLLNLFCYTASISVYAATAGAKSTTNVDMSNTYLDWAKRNFVKNSIDLGRHEFIREDCVDWLLQMQNSGQFFDVIFLDPPTFSNSKRMETHFDLQEAHPQIIQQCINLLNPNGELIFSNNFQKFDMLVESNDVILVREITKQTSSLDFSRRNLHRCWSISRK